MNFSNYTLAFLIGLSAIASPIFVDVVDGAPSESNKDNKSSSESNKDSKSKLSTSRSFKSSKSIKKSKSSKKDTSSIVEFSLPGKITEDLNFSPPNLSTLPIEFGSTADFSRLQERVLSPLEQSLLEHFNNELKLRVGFTKITGTVNFVSGPVGTDEPNSAKGLFFKKCTIASGDYFAFVDGADMDVKLTACDLDICTDTRVGDGVVVVGGTEGTTNCLRMSSASIPGSETIFPIVSGTGMYFDVAGFVKFSRGKGVEKDVVDFKFKYLPSARDFTTDQREALLDF